MYECDLCGKIYHSTQIRHFKLLGFRVLGNKYEKEFDICDYCYEEIQRRRMQKDDK